MCEGVKGVITFRPSVLSHFFKSVFQKCNNFSPECFATLFQKCFSKV